jgi:hypothetical protein
MLLRSAVMICQSSYCIALTAVDRSRRSLRQRLLLLLLLWMQRILSSVCVGVIPKALLLLRHHG